MIITAIVPWLGSKRNLAPEIVRELGPHSVYWGLCFGSAAVEMVKPLAGMETIVDLHGDVINLARVVAHPTLAPVLYRQLRRTLMTDDFHARAKSRLTQPCPSEFDPPSVDRAYWYFISAWLGRNGIAGTPTTNDHFCVRYTGNGGAGAKRFTSAIASIPAWKRRLRNVTILRRNIFEVAPRIEDADGTVIYIDPPYIEKAAEYVHDFTEADHFRLAEILRRFKKTRVVVSYYDHPQLDELYPGWTRRTFNVSKAMASQGKRDKANDIRAVEVLLINGPSLAENTGLFA